MQQSRLCASMFYGVASNSGRPSLLLANSLRRVAPLSGLLRLERLREPPDDLLTLAAAAK